MKDTFEVKPVDLPVTTSKERIDWESRIARAKIMGAGSYLIGEWTNKSSAYYHKKILTKKYPELVFQAHSSENEGPKMDGELSKLFVIIQEVK